MSGLRTVHAIAVMFSGSALALVLFGSTRPAIAMHSPVEPPRLCRICACSEADPCLGHRGACSWVDEDLCSACFTYEPADRLAIIQSAAAERDVAA